MRGPGLSSTSSSKKSEAKVDSGSRAVSHSAEFFEHFNHPAAGQQDGPKSLGRAGGDLAGVPIAWGRGERLRGLVENGAILGVEVEGERTTIRLST